jgi:hypothetical protein
LKRNKQIYQVIADYDSPYTEPFFLKKGETVQIGRRDNEWPGWVPQKFVEPVHSGK